MNRINLVLSVFNTNKIHLNKCRYTFSFGNVTSLLLDYSDSSLGGFIVIIKNVNMFYFFNLLCRVERGFMNRVCVCVCVL